MFLTWFVGVENAKVILATKKLVGEEMIFQIPQQVSSAVQDPLINMKDFQTMFDPDAWESVLQMGECYANYIFTDIVTHHYYSDCS